MAKTDSFVTQDGMNMRYTTNFNGAPGGRNTQQSALLSRMDSNANGNNKKSSGGKCCK